MIPSARELCRFREGGYNCKPEFALVDVCVSDLFERTSYKSIHETFITYFRVPPGGSVTVTWWTLWFRWLGAATPPLPGRENVQLAVTGEDAKGCYVVSWCCPVQAKVDVDVPVTVNIPEYLPPIIPAPEDPGDPGNVDVPVKPGRKKGRKR